MQYGHVYKCIGTKYTKATHVFKAKNRRNGILLPKLFWPTVRKKCYSDRDRILKFFEIIRTMTPYIPKPKVAMKATVRTNILPDIFG